MTDIRMTGITNMIKLFDFELPKRLVSTFRSFFKNERAINAPIKTPLPSRSTFASMYIQVGSTSKAVLWSNKSNLKTFDTTVENAMNARIRFQLIGLYSADASLGCNARRAKL